MLDYVGIDRSARREIWRNPSWEDVERAVDLLDSGDATMLTLSASDETYLTIAGGRGVYVVGASLSSGRFAALVDPARAGGAPFDAVVARERRSFAAEMGVSRETALRAAMRFHRSATLDPALSWAWR